MHPLYEKYRKAKEEWEDYVSSTTVNIINSIPDAVPNSILITPAGDAVLDLASGKTVLYRVLPLLQEGGDEDEHY